MISQPIDNATAPAWPLPGQRKGLAVLIGVTLLWCGGAGIFAGALASTLWRNYVAAGSFHTTQGTVLVSKVAATESIDANTYRPFVKYSYTVQGRPYVSKRYSYDVFRSSDRRHAARDVAANPVGAKVAVFYDPSNPAEAVLTIQSSAIANSMLLFLQPFLAIGMGLIGTTVWQIASHRRLGRFMRSPFDLPWKVPHWGTFAATQRGAAIRRRGCALAGAVGWGLVTYAFVSLLVTLAGVLGAYGDSFVDSTQNALTAIAAALATAMLITLWRVRRTRVPRSELTLDFGGKFLRLFTPTRDVQVKLDDIQCWLIHEVPYPLKIIVRGEPMMYLLLEAQTVSGKAVPVHAFKSHAGFFKQPPEVLQRIAEGFAAITGKDAAPGIVEYGCYAQPAQTADAAKPIAATSYVVSPSGGKDPYADLR